MKKHVFTIAALGALVFGAPAFAADYEVKMLNSGADGMMTFEPGFLKVEPGDTVTFVPTEAAHNSVSHYGPEGGQTWAGAMNQAISVTFEQEGVYLYKCDPHVPLGMVGVIQVGAAKNLAAAKQAAAEFQASIAMNKERLDKYMGQVQ